MLLVYGAILAVAGPAHMQAPLWRGIDTVAIKCMPGADAEADLSCADIVASAAHDAPMTVVAWVPGMDQKPALRTLILSMRFDRDARGCAVFISAARAVSIDDAEGGLLPRRFAWCDTADRSACVDRLNYALDSTLPWRGRSRRA
jgi:hypothetical protein